MPKSARPPFTNEAGDVRELTANDFKQMRPIAEVDPGMVEAIETWRHRLKGRPKVETPKVHIGFRLAADVVDGIKGTGKGYNARVETVLREALARGDLNAEVQRESS
jgi:uncharacterized protein (DUF4415 family)